MVSDLKLLLGLLTRAARPGAGPWWYVSEGQVSIVTGPDDAVATFRFDRGGAIQEVQGSESGPLPPGGTWCPAPGEAGDV